MSSASKALIFVLSIALLAILLVEGVQADPPAQGPGSGPAIFLKNRTFSPPAGVDPALQGLSATDAGKRIHVLLQLDRIPTPQERRALAQQGIELQQYVPNQAWVASVPAGQAATLTSRSSTIRWVGPWAGSDKLSPNVQNKTYPEWALHDSGRVQVMVLLHNDVALSEGEAAVVAHDGIVAGSIAFPAALTAWLLPDKVLDLAAEEAVLFVEEAPPPLSGTNDGARNALRANQVQGAPYNLDGSGVNLFVYDAGSVEPLHQAFTGRLTVFDMTAAGDHPSHVAGTAAGSGAGSPIGRDLKGVAPAALIFSAGYEQFAGTTLFWDNAGDIQADYATARNTYNVDLGTNSIGSNTASNGFNCAIEGDYGVSSAMLDGIVRGDNVAVGSGVLMTWAAGNERTGGGARCGSHFFTTGPPSCAKNPIHVAATNSDGNSMTTFSSWGPCDDGRLKPIVSGPGCESGLVSSSGGENFIYSALTGNTYGGPNWCGTSMATPAVAGVATLAIQDYRNITGNATARPANALMKAWLIHTAKDLGVSGPDYIYGYGEVDALGLINLIRDTTKYRSDTIGSNGETDTFSYTVPAGASEFRTSLAWDDFAATPIISNGAPALVNNLDLEVVAPDGTTIFYPFSLDPANPEQAATTGLANSRDNQEQVIVKNPAAGIWTIRVRGTVVPQAPQSYALVHSHGEAQLCGSNLISNGDFENGTTSWSLDATGAPAAVVPAPAGGSGDALRLGNATLDPDAASQSVTIPATASRALLSFDWYMTSAEAEPDIPYDRFTLSILNNSLTTVLQASDLRSNAWARNAWYGNQNVDLAAFAGQTINISFGGTNDTGLVTRFYVDQVNLTTCVESPILSLKKSAAANVASGGTLSYTIQITNVSNALPATNLIITDTVPASTTLILASLSGDATASGTTPGSLITWNIGSSLAKGNSLSRTFLVTVDGGLSSGQIANTAYGSNANLIRWSASAATTITPGDTRLYLPLIVKQ